MEFKQAPQSASEEDTAFRRISAIPSSSEPIAGVNRSHRFSGRLAVLMVHAQSVLGWCTVWVIEKRLPDGLVCPSSSHQPCSIRLLVWRGNPSLSTSYRLSIHNTRSYMLAVWGDSLLLWEKAPMSRKSHPLGIIIRVSQYQDGGRDTARSW